MRLITFSVFIFVLLQLTTFEVKAQGLDPNIYYLHKAQGVKPWELSLNFGKALIRDGLAETAKKSLIAEPATKSEDRDALLLTWNKRSVLNEWNTTDAGASTLNLMNVMNSVDLSSIKSQAALVFDVRVIKAPTDLVELRMESNWDFNERGTVPLKQALKRLPKKKWISVPIPLQCFDNGGLDFTKVTTAFMLHTEGKMILELGDIRLSAFPQDKVKCAGQ